MDQHIDQTSRTIVITGASSGIGRACAVRFEQLGYRVLAGVRKREDAPGGRIEALPLDVTEPDSVAAAAAALGDEPLHGLVNNAGIAVAGPVELVPLDRWRAQLEVNVLGLVAVTQVFLPALRRGPGRIVNIGSIGGRSALPCSGPYSASKFAVEAITDSLRMELAQFGISVSVIEPGAVATPIWDKSAKLAEELSGGADPGQYPLYRSLVEKVRRLAAQAARNAIGVEEVVKAVEHAVAAPHPRTRYAVGQDAKLRLLINRLPDRVVDRLIMKRIWSG